MGPERTRQTTKSLEQFIVAVSTGDDSLDVYEKIGNNLLEFSAAAAAMVLSCDCTIPVLVPEYVGGDGTILAAVNSLFPDGFTKKRVPIPTDLRDGNKTVETFADPSAATFDLIPSDAARGAAERIGLHHFQRMTMTAEGSIIGAIILAFRKETAPINENAAEALGHVCGMIVREHKARNEKDRIESRHAELIEMLPQPVFETDIEGTLTLVNESAYACFGYSKEEFEAGLNIFTMVHPKDLDTARRNAARVLESGKPGEPTEYALVRKDGSTFPALLTSSPIVHNGERLGLRGVLVDLTGVRDAENRRAQLEAAVEQSAEGILITDAIARVQYVNPAFLKFTGLSREEIIGRLPGVITGAGAGGNRYETMWRTLQNGESWRGVLEGSHQDGDAYLLDAIISPVRGESGTISNFVAVMKDVTYERELEERYRHSQKMEAIGRLAGGIAHDFNNLMTAVAGYSELLRDTFDSDDERLQDVAEILSAVERATNMTGQLLAFSRKQVIQPTRISIGITLMKMRNMLQRLIGEDIKLDLRSDRDLPDVMMDPGQVEQIIINLTLNARDAMPNGGRLLFEAHEKSGPRGSEVVISVNDTGKGMNDETLSRIFEPFFTTKSEGEGTGLGLSTVYGIIEQNNGSITAKSSIDKGTEFVIHLPAIDHVSESDGNSGTTEPDKAAGKLIMLVEDEDLVRNLAAKVLRQSGFEVLSVDNPVVAFETAAEKRPPIAMLITDVVMPGMNGRELADELTKMYPDLSVLFMSGYTNEVISSRGIENGSVPFLQKPFSPAELIEKVWQGLDTANPAHR